MRLRHIILFLLMAVLVTPVRANIHTDNLLCGSLDAFAPYYGNYVYQNGSQRYLTLDCGEVSLSGSTSASPYYFDLKDYQGNVRMAVRSDTSSPFVTDYYPYGGVIRKGKTGTHHRLFKTGISGGQIKNGKSVRAETQVKKWNKESGDGTYKSEITHHEPAGEGSRTRILDYEKERANKYRDQLDPEKHKRP